MVAFGLNTTLRAYNAPGVARFACNIIKTKQHQLTVPVTNRDTCLRFPFAGYVAAQISQATADKMTDLQ
jgi:hypothetical protein